MDFRLFFSERLNELRTAKKLSLCELGQILEISDEAVRLLEKGKRSPSVEVLIHIAQYFHVSTDYLLGLSDKIDR